jgi:hypothetical protein
MARRRHEGGVCGCSMIASPAAANACCMFGVLLSIEGLVTAMRLSMVHTRASAGYDGILMNILQPLPLIFKTCSLSAAFAGVSRKVF